MTAKGSGYPLWRRALAGALGVSLPERESTGSRPAREHRSATEIYLDGGGDPANERTMALLREADRPFPSRLEHPDPPVIAADDVRAQAGASPLHAHEVTGDDAAMIRMMSGARFGSAATVTLPSGRTITGTEMQRWLDAHDR